MDKLELKVKNYIINNNLISNNKLILAFSYGIDSRCLLNVLVNLGYEVIIAHVNHKVRKESDDEEKATIELAKKLNLKYYIKHLSLTNKNFEDNARSERYDFFKEIALKENTNILVTAHHLDDNLETILLRLITGSNLYGYAGIHNKVIKNGLCIVRPFLCTSKDEIKEYQHSNSIEYYEDYTNHLNDHKRNRIRNNIIPLLKSEDPNIVYKAMDYSNILSSSFDYIRQKSISLYNKWGKQIDVLEYSKQDMALRHDIICYMLEQHKLNRNNNLIKTIDSSIMSNKAQFDIVIENNNLFVKRYNYCNIQTKKDKFEQEFKLNLGEKINFLNHTIYFTKDKPDLCENYIKLCYNKLKLPLIIRTRKNGDYITLSSGKKKVKDLFIDKKIPRELRDELPMVISDNDILWIPTVIRSNLVKDDLESGDIYLIDEVNYGKRY